MFRIRNWESYQSYKDRKPPWIRLHKSLLDNYEFQRMSANSRALLPMFWLLASEDIDPVSGLIRIGYEEISFRLRISVKEISSAFNECIANGFIDEIQSCNESFTKSSRNRTLGVTPETETETETESTPPLPPPQKKSHPLMPDWLPIDSWRDFISHRDRLRKPMSAKAKDLIIIKLEKLRAAGHDPVAVINQSIERGWSGVFEIKPEFKHKTNGHYRQPELKENVRTL